MTVYRAPGPRDRTVPELLAHARKVWATGRGAVVVSRAEYDSLTDAGALARWVQPYASPLPLDMPTLKLPRDGFWRRVLDRLRGETPEIFVDIVDEGGRVTRGSWVDRQRAEDDEWVRYLRSTVAWDMSTNSRPRPPPTSMPGPGMKRRG